MVGFLEENFIAVYLCFLLFMGGLFLGSEIRIIQFYKAEKASLEYINEIKKDCNAKIAQARGLK